MKIPRFQIFRKSSKGSSPHVHHNDKPKRGRSSVKSSTSKRKRSITYYSSSNKSRLYPPELFPSATVGVPRSHFASISGNHRGNTPVTMVPIRANIDGERHDIVWHPSHQPHRQPSTMYSSPPQLLPTIHDEEEIIDWPPFPTSSQGTNRHAMPRAASMLAMSASALNNPFEHQIPYGASTGRLLVGSGVESQVMPMHHQTRECVGVPITHMNANAVTMNMNARTQQFLQQPTASTLLVGAPVPYSAPTSTISSFAMNTQLNNQINGVWNGSMGEWAVLNQSSGAGPVSGITMPMANTVGMIGTGTVARHGMVPMGTRLYRRKKVHFLFDI